MEAELSEAEPPEAELEAEESVAELLPDVPVGAFAAAFVPVAAPRSFFAQPLPLNTIAGAAMAFFRACEWQLGHWVGPWSWRP